MSAISLVKAIARQIKYQQLDDLIGREVIINSVDSIFDDVKHELQLPTNAVPVTRDEKYSRIAIAKYGLIDIDYTVQNIAIMKALTDFDAIRTLSLYQEPSGNYSDDDLFMEISLGYLEDMVQDLDSGMIYMMLYLETEHPDDIAERKKQFEKFSIPDNYFPRKFVVEDAALCNTRLAWMMKHFYL